MSSYYEDLEQWAEKYTHEIARETGLDFNIVWRREAHPPFMLYGFINICTAAGFDLMDDLTCSEVRMRIAQAYDSIAELAQRHSKAIRRAHDADLRVPMPKVPDGD